MIFIKKKNGHNRAKQDGVNKKYRHVTQGLQGLSI